MIELPLKRPFSDSYVDGGENSGGQLDTVYLHSNRTHEPPRDTVTMVNRRLRRRTLSQNKPISRSQRS